MKILNAKYLKSVTSPDRSLRGKVLEVSFVGRSNVGKSSMINSLAMRKIAKTSSTPGATRLINLYLIEYEHKGARQQAIFSDFPGFGYAKVSKSMQKDWQKMIEGYIERNKEIQKIIWVYDVRREPDRLDEMLLEWFLDRELPFSIALTKTDKESRGFAANKKRLFKQYIKKGEILTFSAKTGEGRKELLEHILKLGDVLKKLNNN
ncbi:MAG TPA: ribosome biogenesis GTP-binding protein YihA/YsxC [Syntrophorhabdaceae bacterium]|nr:ribosome biogenesis GTP-binding protein YihA/YsxC [Syntrophorhabdaceae bacterium]HQM82297.1 ribosome biogenesis GTP-binding protein YihA/YsxC [Syntrophorhabdaceae bacterium]